ncbi:MAG: peptide chain release factor 1 [Verrucomicrobiales bacterium]|jgi:peptide chain release factor 1|nr:peptide chain release factor 1 [Verrucomicrobiales bacterium]
MNIQPHIERLQKRFAELEALIASPDLFNDNVKAQAVLKEHAQIKNTLAISVQIIQLEKSIAENKELIAVNDDPELTALAQEELPTLEEQLPKLRQTLLTNILPPDPNDSRNTIVEIRAGTGGDEAGIFSADLFRMYSRYAETAGWKIEVMDSSPSTMGGYKEIIFTISGDDVFKKMRFESGVHRVQRVPATESQGRIHTSTSTVAVLPEAKEVDLVIRPDEIRVEVCRAGGPGGQGVNTTDSAVQILHIPSGMIVRCQDGRSQLKNRDKAMNILRSRLLEKKQDEENAKYAANRKQQIGSGDRTEKIRTYNYPQNRITDHRINYTMYNLEAFMEGNIEELIGALQVADVELRLAELDKS